jgi:hypothetical protein
LWPGTGQGGAGAHALVSGYRLSYLAAVGIVAATLALTLALLRSRQAKDADNSKKRKASGKHTRRLRRPRNRPDGAGPQGNTQL